MLESGRVFVTFLTVGAGCGVLLVGGLFNAMANEELLQKDGKTYGQFSIIQGLVGLTTGLFYAFWNIWCPHCMTMRQEQIGVTTLIALNVVAFIVLATSWSVGAPVYPVFVGAVVAGFISVNFTIYLLFPMVATYYAGWLVATVRAGTDVSSLVDKEEGTVTLSESEDESDDSGSDSDEARDVMVGKSKRAYCLEGFACPRKLVLPVILATLSQVAQWGIAVPLGQIGAAMTDPDSCHGSHGKRIYRLSLTSSMIAVPVGSLLSTAVACPRLLFTILSAIQIASAVFIADCALGLFSASADFWKSELGGEVYIVCFALVGGLEGFLLTQAYRYIGDAEDVPGIRRQSASRLLSLLGVPTDIEALLSNLSEFTKADQLQVAAVDLAEAVAEVLTPGAYGDWVLVDDSFPPLPPAEFQALKVLQKHKGLEDGIPEIPEECVRQAARALTGSPEEVLERARSAYAAGFFAIIALLTETPYTKDEQKSEEGHKHWVILYRKTPAISRRVTSRKCLECAITVEVDPVWQGFDSVTELTIFCAGAGIEEPGLIGPSREFNAQLMMEEEASAEVVDLDRSVLFQAVDLDDSALQAMHEYDPAIDSGVNIIPYVPDEPNALPKLLPVIPLIQEWIEIVATERVNFYSAREEQAQQAPTPSTKKAAQKKAARPTLNALASQMMVMQQQLQAVLAQQDLLASGGGALAGSADRAHELPNGSALPKVPALSAGCSGGMPPKTAASLLGPPPRTKAVQQVDVPDVDQAVPPIQGSYVSGGEGPMVSALTQQSAAITQLVAHLTSGDPMSDLAASSSSSGMSLNTKGVARREKMQSDLAQRTSSYFLQIQQQLYKRMNPSRAVPKSAAELAHQNCKETGLVMWILSHAVDAAAQEDFHGTREYLALLVAALEQSALDGGWGVAYVLSLMEEPPQQIFADRLTPMAATGRPFAPLVPPSWAAVALSYMKELEVSQEAKSRGRIALNHDSDADIACVEFKDGVSQVFDTAPEVQASSGGGDGLRSGEAHPFTFQNSDDGPSKDPGTFQMSYPKWCANLVAMVLRSRTPFSAFLHESIRMLRGCPQGPSTPAFFPVPGLNVGQFDRMPSTLSSSRRRQIHLQRAVHVVCMALNFWHAGGRWISGGELRRKPNSEHRFLYRRVASLIRSDGLAESFPMCKSGRKHPELIARLTELSNLLTMHGGGAHASYERGFSGMSVPVNNEVAPELTPFKDLDASRLKLYGSGHWDVTPWLADDLVMAYREPRSLLADLPLGSHPICRDSEEEVAKLARLWDQAGLLRLHRCHRPQGSLVKVFNCFKNVDFDRQIGDRRGQNSLECRVAGPSKDLPAGADVMDLQVSIGRQKAVLVVSDRKDYYHQLWCTTARSQSNAVGPSVHKELLRDTKAYSAFMLQSSLAKRAHREVRGDDLHSFSLHPGESPYGEYLPSDNLWVCFASVLQGDHAGVEIATSAHEQWLQYYNLLDEHSRLVASRSLRSSSLLQGLVIDDYFAVSVEEVSTKNCDSTAAGCYNRSQQAYSSAKLLGSPDKDVVGSNEGKVVGAFINSSERALSRGVCTVGAPPMKRVALSFITLQLCCLPYTTDVLHLCLVGGWVSVLSYRRPLMSILDKSYHLVDQNAIDANNPTMVQLPRSVANELVLLAALMPLALSDLGAEYLETVYATDASMFKGAIVSTQRSLPIVRSIWKSCKSKGSYTRLLSPAEQVLRSNHMFDEESLEPKVPQGPDRPLAYEFDFIEVFSGASLVTRALAERGQMRLLQIWLSTSEAFQISWSQCEAYELALRCQCEGLHVKVEGSFTKASATYVPALVQALADVFEEAINAVKMRRNEELSLEVAGLENQLVNEVARSSSWSVHSCWEYKRQSHINILEEAAILRLVNILSRACKPQRAIAFVDSFVVRGATSKGRSASKALSTVLRRVGAMCVAAALYLTIPFVPTRLNPADDPTRDTPLRPAEEGLDLDSWEEDNLYRLSELPKTRKWASSWVRFMLRILGEEVLDFSDRSKFRQSSISRPSSWDHKKDQFDFDATLGYPGEGPFLVVGFSFLIFSSSLPLALLHLAIYILSILLQWIFLYSQAVVIACWTAAVLWGASCPGVRAPRGFWIFVLWGAWGASAAQAMPIFPKTPGEKSKAAMRQMRPPVPVGRPVLPATQQKRSKPLDEFLIWTTAEGIDIMAMFNNHQLYIDDINLILERYGRCLYDAGKSYGKFAETLNAITSWRPAIRRMLQGAWDFGYAWVRHEPSTHHAAMPGPVCLAILATSIIWGWTQFAGVVALMWAGLLRPGELLAASRADLLLPSDGDMTISFGLLSIKDPKTRFSNARHQSAKLDMEDMLAVIEMFLGPLKSHQRLWPYSGNTLRNRLRAVLAALQLPLTNAGGLRPLELASIRAGSATWLMQTVESGDLLQRRGFQRALGRSQEEHVALPAAF
eukprot:s582_g13.t1